VNGACADAARTAGPRRGARTPPLPPIDRPGTGYWAEAFDRVLQDAAFADRLVLDVCRLRRAVGVLDGADAYVAMAELALDAGYPCEARRVLHEGYRRGLLGGAAPEGIAHGRLRDAVALAARDDEQRRWGRLASPDGDVLAHAGFALALDEQTGRAVHVLERALVRCGLERPDDVRFRLGLAQLWAGHRSDAERTLRAVRAEDGTKELVRLWLLIADNVK
jgi:hypothetical protein